MTRFPKKSIAPGGAVPPARTFDEKKESEKKFGASVASRFTIVPALLFEKQRELNIGATEFAIVLQLMSFWWKADDLPWPSKQKLASRLDMDPSNVRRHITRLCKKGILERVPRTDKATHRQESNKYSFKPLIRKLKMLAKQDQKERDKKTKEQAPEVTF